MVKPQRWPPVVIDGPAITREEAAAGCAFIGTRWLPRDYYEELTSLYTKLQHIAEQTQERTDER